MGTKNKKPRRMLGREPVGTLNPTPMSGRICPSDNLHDAASFHLLGLQAYQQKEYARAEEFFLQAIRNNPDKPEYHYDLSIVYRFQKQFEKAIECLEKAIAINKDYSEAYNNLGLTWHDLEKFDKAVEYYQEALRVRPQFVEALYNFGNLLLAQKEYERAISFYEKVVQQAPEAIAARINLGISHAEMGERDQALVNFNKVLMLEPGNPEAHFNLGCLYGGPLLRLDEAIEHYQLALRSKPELTETYLNLGTALRDRGRFVEAIQCYRKGLEIQPDHPRLHSNLLLTMNHDASLSNDVMLREAKKWWQSNGQEFIKRYHHIGREREPGKIRVGYMSPDFRLHSVCYFFLPLLVNHDRSKFEIFCYAEVANPDEVTDRIMALTDHWRSTVGMSDEAVADLVYADHLDILIDLAGHTANNRLPVFCYRPAPVQVNWLGYPNTTGIPVMDYRLVDSFSDPVGDADLFYTESLIRMPRGFLCYAVPDGAPDVSGLPAGRNGYITFGSFNVLHKINERVVAVWCRIMQRVADSRLILKSRSLGDNAVRQLYLDMFSQHGIGSERLELISFVPSPSDHLALYNKIDICLDSFPYNGTTTTCEALYMGVPVVTLVGDRHASRVGLSILAWIGLADLAANTVEKYIDLAVALAEDHSRLTALRETMRDRMKLSFLCDGKGFARQIENVFQTIIESADCSHVCPSKSNHVVVSGVGQLDSQAAQDNEQGEKLFRAGRFAEAIECFQRAITAMPDDGLSNNNLGAALWQQGKLHEAARCFIRALQLDPDDQDARANLDDLLQSVKQPVKRESDFDFDAEYERAKKLFLDGALNEAAAICDKILAAQPDQAETYHLLGLIESQKNNIPESVRYLEKAILLKKDSPFYYYDLANGYLNLANLDQAISCYKQAIKLNSEYAEAHANLGLALQRQKKSSEALESYQEALRIRPGLFAAHCNMGTVYSDLFRFTEAVECYKKALKVGPENPVVYGNLGNAYKDLAFYEKAAESYRQSLALHPDAIDVLNNLATLYVSQGRVGEAVECYRKVLEKSPAFFQAQSNLLLALNYLPDASPKETAEEARKWWRLYGGKKGQIFKFEMPKPVKKRLRVGYLSPDFRRHSVSYFFSPLLSCHNRDEIEAFCYADVKRPDQVTEQIKSLAEHWCLSAEMSDTDLAKRIFEDRIDILVDLAGHTAGNRLQMFALRPAPIRVSWLGYPATTGMAEMDYRLVDSFTDPEGAADKNYTETLLRLPRGFLCYGIPEDIPDVAELPAGKAGFVTFGSFNNIAKVNEQVISVWCEILKQVSGSKLVLKNKTFSDPLTRKRYLKLFAKYGVTKERIQLLPKVTSLRDHFASYNQVDIALDPFPYNGTTTTCEGLSMGVPVIALCGDRHAARVSADLLQRIGLEDLIAHSEEEYINSAVRLATDLDRMQELRSALRSKMQASPLCDAPGFARQIEDAYQQMWVDYCNDMEVDNLPSPHQENNFSDDPKETAEEINRQGEDSFTAGRIQEALESFRKSVDINPEYPEALNNLGVVFWHLGELHQAVKYFTRTLQLSPQHFDAAQNLDEVLMALKKS